MKLLRMGTKIGLRKEVEFLVLTDLWFVFGFFFGHQRTSPGLFAAWVVLASLVSIIAMTASGYFDHHIPRPRLSAIISLLLVLPLSALISKWLMMLSSHIPPIRYSEAFGASLGVALMFELAQVGIFKVHRAMGRKWTLATHLAPEELDTLCAQIELSGASWWIDVRTYQSHGKTMRGDETVVISRKAVRHLKDHPELLAAHLRGQRIVDVRELLKEFRGRVSLQYSDGWTFLLGSTYQTFLLRLYFYVKEIVEVILAILLSILMSPLLLALAFGVYITNGRPILYRQQRLGYRGKQFALYKYRTMPVTAEDDGPKWATKNDPRAKGFGGWLRKNRLDEMPQLLNVIRGDLSFVGPRPERPEFYNLLQERIPLFSTRLLVRPGITGWAQVRQGYASSVEECRRKLEYDLYYVQNMSPNLDLKIMMHTVAVMLRGNSGQ